MKESRYGYFFIAPCVLTIIFVLGFPLVYVICLSFFKYRPLVSLEWAGLANYADVIKNPSFVKALVNTFVFSLNSVFFHVILGMCAALILNTKFRGRVFLRTLYLLPWMLSYVVGSITWRWMLNNSYGILNEILMRMGLIDSYRSLLGDPSLAMFFVVLANIWKQFPFVMLMFIAGLQSISLELYDAARIDGAGDIRCFFSITLPSMKQIITITATLDFIWSFKQFDLISIMTGGGPGNSTEVLSTLIHQTLFNAFNFGGASAAAAILLVVVIMVSLLYARFLFSNKNSEAY